MSIDFREAAQEIQISHSFEQSAADAKLLAYWENELAVPAVAFAITTLKIESREALLQILQEDKWSQLHKDLQDCTEGSNGFSVVLRQYLERHIPREAKPNTALRFIPKPEFRHMQYDSTRRW